VLDLRYDFNNLMAERVGDHGITEAELKALSLKIEAAAAALEKNPPAFRTLPHTGSDRWAAVKTSTSLPGAAAMNALCTKTGALWQNPALTGAAMMYLIDKAKGKNIHLIMSYREELASVTNWFSHLAGESLGKRLSRAGKIVHCGQTPVSVSGERAVEAMMQLCIEGPYDKVVTFLTVGEPDARQNAAELALTKSGRPNCALRLSRLDEETMGALMFLLAMQIAYAGELYGVNVYDQPGRDFFHNNFREPAPKANPLFVVTT
jgi:glucose-6-phosphate isomerase